MQFARRRSIVWIVALLVTTVTLAAFRPLCMAYRNRQIAYHRQEMVYQDRLYSNALPQGVKARWMPHALDPVMCIYSELGSVDSAPHRDKLVTWGEIDSIDYQFRHIRSETTAWRHLWDQIQSDRCPQYDHDVGILAGSGETWGNTAYQPVRLKVWCPPAQREAWRNYLQSVDVQDYHLRFPVSESTKP